MSYIGFCATQTAKSTHGGNLLPMRFVMTVGILTILLLVFPHLKATYTSKRTWSIRVVDLTSVNNFFSMRDGRAEEGV